MGDVHFFNLNDLSQGIARDLTEELRTRIFRGESVIISVVVKPNKSGAIHNHFERQPGVMLEGDGGRIQDGVEHLVKAGKLWRTPGNASHSFVGGPGGAVILDIFSAPLEEYKKADSGVGN
ncbi:MAG: cupin domain-containing protein [Betaproteobacteria bacterium]|jgi:quercetin dioxygenase-like cupin family protein|nr:MAG: cupin domain-containing protein [Betaproteobacteria bacterium]